MTQPALITNPVDTEALERDAARYAAGVLSLDGLAALHGLDAVSVLTVLDDPEVQKRIDRHIVTREQSGDTTRERARAALGKCIQRIAQIVEHPDTSSSTLLRATEILDRLAPVTPKEMPKPEGEKFSITINLSSDKNPLRLGQSEVIDV